MRGGYVGTAPDAAAAVVALSLSGLRAASRRFRRLEMLEYANLSSRHADRQRLAVCHAKLDDIGAVALRTIDHDAVLAARRSHALLGFTLQSSERTF
jgi:hypothetical protein